jgi:hypothetical protein
MFRRNDHNKTRTASHPGRRHFSKFPRWNPQILHCSVCICVWICKINRRREVTSVFWDVTSCESCYNLRFGECVVSIFRVERICKLVTDNVTGSLLVTANVHPSWRILYTLKMEKKLSFETSVVTRATQRHIDNAVKIWNLTRWES